MAETARYAYAIGRGISQTGLSGVSGIDGAPLETVEHRGLTAVVSTVDLAEYGEEGLRRNLERLDWLEAVARAHDAVVQHTAQLGPTAPLRLATIFLDDQAVRQRLDQGHDQLAEVLDRVEGRMEWSLKVFEPERASTPSQDSAETSGAPLSGAAYLRRKKEATQARMADEERLVNTAQGVHDAVAARCVASRRLPPQDPRLTGHRGTMLLNAAYLVESEGAAGFEKHLQDLVTTHPELHIEYHGPWPPYSFAVLEQS